MKAISNVLFLVCAFILIMSNVSFSSPGSAASKELKDIVAKIAKHGKAKCFEKQSNSGQNPYSPEGDIDDKNKYVFYYCPNDDNINYQIDVYCGSNNTKIESIDIPDNKKHHVSTRLLEIDKMRKNGKFCAPLIWTVSSCDKNQKCVVKETRYLWITKDETIQEVFNDALTATTQKVFLEKLEKLLTSGYYRDSEFVVAYKLRGGSEEIENAIDYIFKNFTIYRKKNILRDAYFGLYRPGGKECATTPKPYCEKILCHDNCN